MKRAHRLVITYGLLTVIGHRDGLPSALDDLRVL